MAVAGKQCQRTQFSALAASKVKQSGRVVSGSATRVHGDPEEIRLFGVGLKVLHGVQADVRVSGGHRKREAENKKDDVGASQSTLLACSRRVSMPHENQWQSPAYSVGKLYMWMRGRGCRSDAWARAPQRSRTTAVARIIPTAGFSQRL